jgi:hypothetical protein
LLTSRTVAAADALPTGSRIASFEIEAVIARGPTSFVYLAQDLTRGMPVAIKEYAPARRMGGAPNEPLDPSVQRGLQAFMAEARMLAACHHPSLVRVEALLDAHGTAYRVMPFYKGLSLVHLRTGLGRSPDDATLRAWGADLVGALQAVHGTGHAHGGVSPENILLLADDRPLLFGAGSACHRVGSDLVESLLADFGLGSNAAAHGVPTPELIRAASSGATLVDAAAYSGAPIESVADDMRALAAVLRFCVNGEPVLAKQLLDSPAPYFDGAPVGSPRQLQAARQTWLKPSVEDLAADSVESVVQPSIKPPPSQVFAGPAHLSDQSNGASSADEPLVVTTAPSAIAPALTQRPLIPQRWHIPLWVGLIALTGVAVLATMGYVMGAWNRMPPIDFDRALQTAPVLTPVPAPAPAPVPAPVPAPAALLRPSSASASTASGALNPVGALTEPQDTPAAGKAAVANRLPQNASRKVTTKSPPKRLARRAKPAAAAKVASPVGACGARTNFALERCMQVQCQNKRWAAHPQCKKRRAA